VVKEEGCPFKATPAYFGFMSMAKWREDFLLHNSSPDTNLYAVQFGIRTERQMLLWVDINQKSFIGRAGAKAAKSGHLEVLQWAVANGFPVGRSTITAAAGAGRLGSIKWLVERNPSCEWDGVALERAARGGHLDVIQWLVELHPNPRDLLSVDEYIAHAAAEGGHLHVLKWLHEKGATIGSKASSAATESGWLEV